MTRKRWRVAAVAAAALVGVAIGGGGALASGTPAAPLGVASAGTLRALPAVAGGTVTGGPTGVSCPTAGWCAAVGDLQQGSDTVPGGTLTGEGTAEAWVLAAGRWRPAPLPLPADSAAIPEVTTGAVSCPEVGYCVALATYQTSAKVNNEGLVAETLSGGVWRATKVAMPAGTFPAFDGSNAPSGLSCAAVRECVGVASVFDGKAEAAPIVYRLAGRRWTARVLPLPHGTRPQFGQAFLNAVSCPSATRCVAVGDYYGPSGSPAPLVESWHGSTWKADTAIHPSHARNGAVLDGVSCPADGICLAAGSVFSGNADRALTAHLSQGRWTTTVFATATGGRHLDGIACPSTTSCTAVGAVGVPDTARTTPLVATWDGAGWSVRRRVGSAALEAVSCPAAGLCRSTVGYFAHDRVDTLRQGRLSATILPLPVGPPVAALDAVSCASAAHCAAVGGYATRTRDRDLFEMRGPTGRWTATTGVEVKGTYAGLTGVSCAPGGAGDRGCVAVGSKAVAVLSDGRWHARLLPVPAGTHSVTLSSVSCPKATVCVAVGSADAPHTARPAPLIASLSGTHWSFTFLPDPAGATEAGLDAVSCPTTGNCMAVGFTSNAPDSSAGLAERLKDGVWTPSSPAGALKAVACPSTTSWCVAAGVAGFDATVDRWDGSAWRTRTVGQQGSNLEATAVACPAAEECAVTGDSGTPGSAMWVVTVRPSSMSGRHAVAGPPGSVAGALDGIVCPSSRRCVAVGGDTTREGSFALAGVVAP